MQVQFSDTLGSNAGQFDHASGKIFLNSKLYPLLPPMYQRFIKYHEEGHAKLNTFDELAANRYAFEKFKATEPQNIHKLIKYIKQSTDMNDLSERTRLEDLTDMSKGAKPRGAFVSQSNYQLNIFGYKLGQPTPEQSEKNYYQAVYGNNWQEQMIKEKSQQSGNNLPDYIILAIMAMITIAAIYILKK